MANVMFCEGHSLFTCKLVQQTFFKLLARCQIFIDEQAAIAPGLIEMDESTRMGPKA